MHFASPPNEAPSRYEGLYLNVQEAQPESPTQLSRRVGRITERYLAHVPTRARQRGLGGCLSPRRRSKKRLGYWRGELAMWEVPPVLSLAVCDLRAP